MKNSNYILYFKFMPEDSYWVTLPDNLFLASLPMLSKAELKNLRDWKQFQDLWKDKIPSSYQKVHLYVQEFEKSRDRWMKREGAEYEDKCYDLHNVINNTEVSMPSTQQVKPWTARESAANMREYRAQPTRHINAGERKHHTASEKSALHKYGSQCLWAKQMLGTEHEPPKPYHKLETTYYGMLLWTQAQRVINSRDPTKPKTNVFKRASLTPDHPDYNTDPSLFLFSKRHAEAISPPTAECLSAALQDSPVRQGETSHLAMLQTLATPDSAQSLRSLPRGGTKRCWRLNTNCHATAISSPNG